MNKRSLNQIIAILLIVVCAFSMGGCGEVAQPQPTNVAIGSSSSDSSNVDDSTSDNSEQHRVVPEIDMEKYAGVVLEETPDAGNSYINETLFIGDSNTARLSTYNLTGFSHTLGVVSMGIQGALSENRIWFYGHDVGYTMAQAVGMLQPRRIIISFGTNNAGGSSTEDFIAAYRKVLNAMYAAYPAADIIISAVPPMGKGVSDLDKKTKSIIAYNQALVELAAEMDLTFLNTSEVLQDPTTGYAYEGMVVEDGIHLTEKALSAQLQYYRTHSHIVPDTRTTVSNVPNHMPEPVVEETTSQSTVNLDELDITELEKLDTVNVRYITAVEGEEPKNGDGTSAFTGGVTGSAKCVRGGSTFVQIAAAAGYGFFVQVTPGCAMDGDNLVVPAEFVGSEVEVVVTYYLQ